MKKIFIILCCLLICNSLIISRGSASLRPIIVPNIPPSITTTSHNVSLSWNIIDDNPRFYSIYQNGSILKNNISIVSDIVNFDFNAIDGGYNITFMVYDYSGFSAQSNTLITISYVATSSSSTSSNSGSTSTSNVSSSSSSSGQASPGYSYIAVLCVLLVFSLSILLQKGKRKQM